ncbi:MAG: hypothetical protein A2017_12080 [Lentisphaerae bacterium GWF2_44_16]|nr:MAG: hypothetical protein A2017_12080 [Lentisphaerae bacterium GWF2_44_16]
MSMNEDNHYQKKVIIISAVALIAVLLSLQTLKKAASHVINDFFYPYFSFPSFIADKISNQTLMLRSKKSLALALEELQKKNNELFATTETLKGLSAENNELRSLIGIKPRNGYKCIFAEVLLRDPVYWDERFTVRKGSVDGIEEGSVVLAPIDPGESDGNDLAVIGRVKSVTKHCAVIETLISGENKLSVKLLESDAPGIIQYGGRKGGSFWAIVKYLPRDLNYTQGEGVYTSGLSGYTAPSLFVGRLSENEEDIKIHDNLYVEAKIDLAGKFDDIRFVLIMVKNQE